MTIAEELATLLAWTLKTVLPLRLRAWDGSEAGPAGAPVLHIKDRDALRRLLRNPGELALAQAYVTGEIDVDGDLRDGLDQVLRAALALPKPGPGALVKGLPFALRHGLLRRPPAPPRHEAALSGRRHSRDRDAAAISHHYDLSNDFYARLLDDHLVYSCAYWTSDDPDYGLAEAQHDKLELICRKLRLRPGMRLLDVGCGWGALAIHAAAHHEVEVVAVTLSRQQHAFATERARAEGVAVDFRRCDYRDLPDTGFDAVSTVEMGEHVGEAEYPAFAAGLRSRLRPGGRLLVQQMSRGATAPGGGAFIETYIAPDMHMRPLGDTVGLLEHAGLEILGVEALREHYVRTVDAWAATLEADWDAFVRDFGEEQARVWRLYLAGGALAFAHGRMGVDQILAAAPDEEPSTTR